jgi:hypothetical protein
VLQILAIADVPLLDAELERATGIPGDLLRPRRNELRKAGLVVQAGRRQSASGKANMVWDITESGRKAAEAGEPVPFAQPTRQEKLEARINALWEELSDPEVREGLKATAEDSRNARRNLAVIRMYEEEDERRAVEAQKQAIKLSKAAGEHALRRHQYWERLDKEIEAFLRIVGPYVAEFDNLPATIPAQLKIVDRDIERVIRTLKILQRKMFPGREEGVGDIGQGSYITIN